MKSYASPWFRFPRKQVDQPLTLLKRTLRKRPQPLQIESLEPRLLLSVTPTIVGQAVTFDQTSIFDADAIYLRSDGGFMQWSTDGSAWSSDFDLSTSGDQTLTIDSTHSVSITAHVLGAVHLDSILSGGGSFTLTADTTVTLETDATLSTRNIGSATDQLDAASLDNSGAIHITAPVIVINAGARVLAHVLSNDAETAGNITLTADDHDGVLHTQVINAKLTDASVTVSGTIRGGDVTITSDANSSNTFSNSSTPSDGTFSFLQNLTLVAGVSISTATSAIQINAAADISGANLVISASAETTAKMDAIALNLGLAVALGKSDPHATVTIDAGATINATGNASITTGVEGRLDLKAQQSPIPTHSSTPSITIAAGTMSIVSTVTSSGTLTVGGTLEVHAHAEKSLDVQSNAGSYDDGMAGLAVAYSDATVTSTASLGGTVSATGAIGIIATYNSDRDRTSATSQVGNGIAAQLVFGLGSAGSSVSSWFSSAAPTPDAKSGGSSVPFAASGAIAASYQTNNVTAQILSGASVTSSGGRVDVLALSTDSPQIATIAMVDSQSFDDGGHDKQLSIAVAVNIASWTNNITAKIGSNATVTAKNAVTVQAYANVPQISKWDQIHGFGDITDKLNTNLGVQNGFFNSWAQAGATGSVGSFAGSVDFVTLNNNATATIEASATVSETRKGSGAASFTFNPLTDMVNGVIQTNASGDTYLNTGDAIVYNPGAGPGVNGLSNGETYYVIRVDATHIKLAATREKALLGTAIATPTVDKTATLTSVAGEIPQGVISFLPASIASGVITHTGDDLLTGTAVKYSNPGWTNVTNLVDGQTYYIIRVDATHIKLASTKANALAEIAISGVATGTTPTRAYGIVVKQGVFVTAQAETQTVNLSGVMSIGQIKDLVLGGVQKPSYGGVGGSYLGVTQNTNATAKIKTGATVTGYAVHVKADTGNRMIGIAESGGKGGKLAIFGSFSDLDSTDTVLAQIERGATITANGSSSPDPVKTDKNLLVHANDDAQLYTFAGGLAKGDNVGIGAAVAINEVTRNVSAVLGDTTADATPSGAVSTSGKLGVEASGTGQIISASLAAAVTSDETPDPSKTKSAPKTQGGGQEPKFGISLSGDVALNQLTTVTKAWVHNANITGAAGMSVTAVDDSNIIAVAGSVAISTSSGASAGIAGSYTENIENVTTTAIVDHSTLANVGALSISASGDEDILSISASGSGSSNGVGVAGQVSYNTITSDTEAGIVNGTEVKATTSSVVVTAVDDSRIIGVSGALGYGGKSGIGASIVLNDVDAVTKAMISASDVTTTGGVTVSATGKRQIIAVAAAIGASGSGMAVAGSVAINQIDTDSNKGVYALISGKKSTGISAGGNISVSASNTVNHDNAPTLKVDSRDPSILAITGSIASSGGGGAGIGFSFSKNDISTDVKATIDNTTVGTTAGTVLVSASGADVIQALAVGGADAGAGAIAGSVTLNSITDVVEAHVSSSTVTSTGNITIQSTLGGTIQSLAGAVALSASASVGAAAASDTITNTAKAYVDASTVTSSAGSVAITALSNALIQSMAVAGSSSDTLSIAGSVAVNTIRNTVDAHVSATVSTGVSGFSGVTMSSTDTSTIDALAGALSIGGPGALGASVSTNDIANNVSTYVSSTGKVTSGSGSVALSATETGTINAITAGGTGAGTFAAGGSVSLNQLVNTVDTYVTGTSTVTGSSGVTLTSTDNPTIHSLAGQVTGAGTVAIGAALATNDIGDTVKARIEGSTVTSGLGSVSLGVTSSGEIKSLSAGISGSGTVAIGGAISLNKIHKTLDAHATSSTLTGNSDVSITAADTSEIHSLSGQIDLSLVAAVGGAAAYNDISNTVSAYSSSSTVTATGGSITISANQASSIETVSVSGSVSPFLSVGGSVIVNMLDNTVKAYVTGGTVTADDNVVIKATETNGITAYGGTLNASIAAGYGATVVVNTSSNDTQAYVDGGTVIAKANGGTVSVPKWTQTNTDTTETSENVKGLSIIASSNLTLTNYIFSLSIGSTAVGVNVLTNVVGDTTKAFINDNTTINSNAQMAGSVKVRAHEKVTATGYSGALAGGGDSVGADVETTLINNTTQAYIKDSNATNRTTVWGTDIEVSALSTESVTTNVAGLGVGGSIGVAGSAAGVVIKGTTEAYIAEADINSLGDLRVLANDRATIVANAGSGGLSALLAGGGSIGLTAIGMTTKAHMDGAVTNAKNATQVQADQSSSINVHTGTLAAGGIASIAGAIIVAPIGNLTQAYIQSSSRNSSVNQDAAYKTANQTLTVKATDISSIVAGAGTLAISLVASGGAAVSAPTIKNKVEAFIGDNTSASAKGGVTVQATSDRTINSGAVANGGAIGFSINGAYSLVGIGTGIDSSGAGLIGALVNAVSNAMSRSTGAPELPSDTTAQKAKTNSTTAEFSASDGLSTAAGNNATNAYIGDATVTTESGNIFVNADANITSTSTAGGVTVGLLAGIGGSMATANISADTEAHINSGATVTATAGKVEVIADGTQISSTAKAAAGAGGIAGFSNTESRSTINSTVKGFVDSTAGSPTAITASGGVINIKALSLTTTTITANASSGGIIAGASAYGDGYVTNTVAAYAGAGATLTGSSDVTILATSNNTINSTVTGGSGGLAGAGSGESTAQVTSYNTQAYLGAGAHVTAAGTFTLEADNTEYLNAYTSQGVYGAIASNSTSATAKVVTGLTQVDVGANAVITANIVIIKAKDVSLYYKAEAVADVGAVGSTNSAVTTADASSNTNANIQTGATITGTTSVAISADILSGQFDSHAKTTTTGLTGTLSSSAGSNKATYATVFASSGSTITTKTLSVTSSVPYTQTTHYLKDAETNAQTVVNYVTVVIGTACNIIGTVACGWGLFCDAHEVCSDITETIREVLGATVTAVEPGTESLLNKINFNSTVNIQGAVDPVFTVDATGHVTSMSGLTAHYSNNAAINQGDLLTGDIYLNPILNTAVGGVSIIAINGRTEGNSTINFNPSFNTVAITNASSRNLHVGNIEVFNTTTPPTIIHQANHSTQFWTYTLITNSDTTLVDIENTSSTPTDMFLEGHILNPNGTTKLYNTAGNILGTGSSNNIITRLADLKADLGTIGNSTTGKIYLALPVNDGDAYPAGITQAVGYNGVFLNITPRAHDGIVNVAFKLSNVSSAHGNVLVQIEDGLTLQHTLLTQLTLFDGSKITGVLLDGFDGRPGAFGPSGVDSSTDTIHLGYDHGLLTGDSVSYSNGGGVSIGGLQNNRSYHAIKVDDTSIQLGETFGASNVNTTTDTITFTADHAFKNGDKVIYTGTATGLTTGGTYYVRVTGTKTIQLVQNLADVIDITKFVNITSAGAAGQKLRMDLDNDTGSGDLHKIFTASYYIQVGNTVTRVPFLKTDGTPNVTNFQQGISAAAVASDTTVTLENVSAFGDLTIEAGSGGLAHSNVILSGSITAGGTASIHAVSGNILSGGGLITGLNISITADDGNVGTNAANIQTNVGTGHIDGSAALSFFLTETTGDLRVGLISASTGQVKLTASSGSILDADNDSISDVNADTITLTATGSIGTVANALEIDPVSLTATSAGDIVVTETAGAMTAESVTSTGGSVYLTTTAGDLNVKSISAAVGNVTLVSSANIVDVKNDGTAIISSINVTMTATGSIGSSGNDIDINTTVAGALTADAASIYVNEVSGGLRVNHAKATTGDVRLTVKETAASGEDLTVLASGEVSSVSGTVTLRAGDDITIAATGLVRSQKSSGVTVSLIGDFGNLDGAGTTIIVNGAISGIGVAVSGNSNNDQFIFNNLSGINAGVGGGLVTVDGSGGSDSLTLNDSANSIGRTGQMTSTNVSGLNMGGNGVDYANVEDLTVNLSQVADTFTINSTNSTTLTHVWGNGGNDTLNVATIDSDTDVHGGTGDDTINVGRDAGSYFTVDGIHKNLTVAGDAHTTGDQLNIKETNEPAGSSQPGTLTSTTVTGLGMPVTGVITYGTVEDLTINLGLGNDTFTIASTHSGTTELYGNAGNDTLNVQSVSGVTTVYGNSGDDVINVEASGKVDSINAMLNIHGGGDSGDVLNVDDSSDTDANTGTLTSTRITGLDMAANDASKGITYDGFPVLNITLGSGADIFTILSTHAGTTNLQAGAGSDLVMVETIGGLTNVLGGDDNDTLDVNLDLINPSASNGLAALLVLDGQDGSDLYNINIWGNGNSHIVAIDNGTGDTDANTMVINGTGLADSFLLRRNFVAAVHGNTAERIDYDETMNGGLTINSLGGDDKFAVDDNSVDTHLFGGSGKDTFQIGQMFLSPRDVPQVAGGDEADTILSTKGYLTNGASFSLDAHGGTGNDTFVMFHNTATVGLYGDEDDDSFVVRAFILDGSEAIDPHQQRTNVAGGAGNDNVNYTVNAPVNIDGGAGSDVVVVVGTEADDIFVVTDTNVYGAGLSVSYINVEKLRIEALEGDDSIYIVSTAPGVQTEIYGGVGNDHFYTGDSAPAVVSNDLLGYTGLVAHSIDINGNLRDVSFDGITVPGISAHVQDNLTAGVIITPSGGNTTVTEGGAADTYTVRLTTAPTAEVRITINVPVLPPEKIAAGDKTVELSANGSPYGKSVVLIFTAANWQTAQTVSVKAPTDGQNEGSTSMPITHSVTSTDLRYHRLPVANLNVNVIDVDASELVITPSGGTSTDVVENDINDTYTLALTHAPVGSVTVTITPDAGISVTGPGGTGTSGSPLTVTFDSSNWQGVTLTVSAPNDGTIQGAVISHINHVVSGGDASFAGQTKTMLVNRYDDDAADVIVMESDGSTNILEGGSAASVNPLSDTYQVRLTKAPEAGKTVTILITTPSFPTSSTQSGQLSSSVASLTFTAANWNVFQTVKVFKTADAVGTIPYYHSFGQIRQTLQGIQGPVSIFGGESGDPATSIPNPLMLPTETNPVQYNVIIPTPVIEANSIDTLSVNNTDSRSNDTGTLTSTRLYGLGMGGDQVIGGVTINGGITYGGLEIIDIKLGSGNDTLNIESVAADAITVVRGNAGNDTFNITAPATNGVLVVYGDNAASTSYRGAAGDDTVNASTSTLGTIIYGGGGKDKIYAGSGNDWIAGGSGDDTLSAGNGNDVVFGDSGFDVDLYTRIITVRTSGNPSSLDNFDAPGADTITDGTGTDVIFGDHGAITQIGGVANVLSLGGVLATAETVNETRGGNDSITTGDGKKIVFGGKGNDTIGVGNGTHVIVGDNGTSTFAADGTLLLISTRSEASGGDDTITTGSTGDNTILGGSGADKITAGNGRNVIIGDNGSASFNSLAVLLAIQSDAYGVGGDDQITTGSGDDVIIAGVGADTVTSGNGYDIILGDNGNASFNAAATLLSISTLSDANGGADVINTGTGRKVILGGLGGDTITTGTDAATRVIIGDQGSATFNTSGILTDITSGTPSIGGNDSITTGNGNDVIIGGVGADTVSSGDGYDIILGDNGTAHFDGTGILRTIATGSDTDGAADGITSGTGAKVILGGLGGDTITTGSDATRRIIIGDQGSATFNASGILTDITSGTPNIGGIDNITTGNGNDVIIAGVGGDTVKSGDGYDVIIGDNGTAHFDDAGTLRTISTGSDTEGAADSITSGTGAKVILGGLGGDTITTGSDATRRIIIGDQGSATFNASGILTDITSGTPNIGGNDGITTGNGNDVIIGGVGADTVISGDGYDVIVGDNGTAHFDDAGTLRTISTGSDVDGAADGITSGTGAKVILGGLGGDTITTGSDASRRIVIGDQGSATFNASGILTFITNGTPGIGGDDKITTPGSGDDVIIGGAGADTISAYDGRNLIFGDNGNASFNDAGALLTMQSDASAFAIGGNDYITTGSGNDVVIAGVGDDTVTTGSGDDIVLGDNGAVYYNEDGIPATLDKVVTSASTIGGADSIYAGEGNDIVLGGFGNDKIYGAGGVDVLVGDNGQVDLISGLLAVVKTTNPGDGGADEIKGEDGDDFILGGAAGDTISGGAGADIILGDNGLLTFASGNFVKAEVLDPTIGGNDSITGDAGDDVIIGGTGSDTISGGDNNDLIAGDHATYDRNNPLNATFESTFIPAANGGAADDIHGDAGNDIILGGNGGDTIHGDGGNDLVFGDHGRINGNIDLTKLPLALTDKPFTFTSTGIDVVANGGNDQIWGGDGEDILIGGQGSDTIRGEAGNDDIIGGHNVATGLDEGDFLDGGSGEDVIAGDNASILRNPTAQSLLFRALLGTLIYNANGSLVTSIAQNNPSGSLQRTVLLLDHSTAAAAGTSGNDYIAGGAGQDQIWGQLGDDVIQGDNSIELPVVGAYRDGNNELQLKASQDHSDDGDDYIEGGGGNDVIFGNQGQDDIIGGSSNLFGLDDPSKRPDGSDFIFGGSGLRIALDDAGNPTGTHGTDADVIIGDNGNIYRLVGVNGVAGIPPAATNVAWSGGFLNYTYDNSTGPKIIVRAIDQLDYTPGGPSYSAVALTDIGAADEVHGESGDDFIWVGKGSDVVFGDGQDDNIIGGYGNDWISGGTGDDGILGDDGRIFTSRNGQLEPLNGVLVRAVQSTIATGGNMQTATINVTGQLKKTVDLTPFSTQPGWNPDGGDEWGGITKKDSDDIIFGGLGNDWIHGGSGDDAISGAEALGTPSYAPIYDSLGNPINVIRIDFDHPFNPGNVLAFNPIDVDGQHANSQRAGEFPAYDEYDPLRKILLTGTGGLSKTGSGLEFFLNFNQAAGPASTLDAAKKTDGDDKIFGDLGNDWLVGGTGRDDLYGGLGNDLMNADDDLTTNTPDTSASYEDRAFGGGGRDVLIANTGGDRLIDWTGEYNSYLVPFSPFGAATVSRALQPGLMDFLYQLSASDGADPTRASDVPGADPARNGEPWGELGLVLQKDAAWSAQHGGPADPQPGNSNGARDVLRSANFDTGAQGFSAQVGTFSTDKGRYQVSASTKTGDAISLFNEAETVIPGYFEMQALINAVKPTGGVTANAYLIFDWQSNTDFKYAGIDISTNKLVIGHRTASAWVVDAWTVGQFKAGTDYVVMLKINGNQATLTSGLLSVSFTFAPRTDTTGIPRGLNGGLVGIGASDGASAQIDDVIVQAPPATITLDKTVDFDSVNPASILFNGQSTGTWTTTSDGRSIGSTSDASKPAINLIRYKVAPGALAEITTTFKTSNQGGVVFDYQSPAYYKFATISADGKQILIGHRVGANTVIDRTFSMNVSTNSDYKFTVAMRGGLVNVSVNGAVVASYLYNETVTMGGYGLISMKGAGSTGQTSFDSVRFRTDDAQYATSSTLTVLPASQGAYNTVTLNAPAAPPAAPSVDWDAAPEGLGDIWSSDISQPGFAPFEFTSLDHAKGLQRDGQIDWDLSEVCEGV